MNKVYDLAEKLTKTLSNKITEIAEDKSLDEEVKYHKMTIYSEVIDIISNIVREVIQRWLK